MRALEIIGEAANKVTSETRDRLENIPWHNIIGLRNRVIHDDRGVNYDIIWEVVTLQLSMLIHELQKVLPPEADDSAPP